MDAILVVRVWSVKWLPWSVKMDPLWCSNVLVSIWQCSRTLLVRPVNLRITCRGVFTFLVNEQEDCVRTWAWTFAPLGRHAKLVWQIKGRMLLVCEGISSALTVRGLLIYQMSLRKCNEFKMSYLYKYCIWRLQIFYSNLTRVEIVYYKIYVITSTHLI